MTTEEALTTQRDEARADRDLYKRVLDGIVSYLQTGEVDELVQAKSTTFHQVRAYIDERKGLEEIMEAQLLKYQTALTNAEHRLDVEKGRPGCDSYRDDVLKVTCAMLVGMNVYDSSEVVRTAQVVVAKVYLAAVSKKG